jgi:hypothetical protein
LHGEDEEDEEADEEDGEEEEDEEVEADEVSGALEWSKYEPADHFGGANSWQGPFDEHKARGAGEINSKKVFRRVVEMFDYVFPVRLQHLGVTKTNEYIRREYPDTLEMDPREFRALLAVILFMGNAKPHRRADLWQADMFGSPWVQSMFPNEKRLTRLLCSLRWATFADYSSAYRHSDSLWRVRPLFGTRAHTHTHTLTHTHTHTDELNKNWMLIYTPKQRLSFDEVSEIAIEWGSKRIGR